MAPKRSGKVVSVKKTKKVVEETVNIQVLGETLIKEGDQNKKKLVNIVVEDSIKDDTNKKNEAVVEKKKKNEEEPEKVVSPLKLEGPNDDDKKKKQGEIKKTLDEEEIREKKGGQNQKINKELEKKKDIEGGKEIKVEKKRVRKRKGSGDNEVGGSYKRYVFKVLKQVHPEMGISSKGMIVINGLMNDMFERLADEAAKLCKYTGRLTMSSREIQGAVRLVLPGELGKHAIAEGIKAVTTYMSEP